GSVDDVISLAGDGTARVGYDTGGANFVADAGNPYPAAGALPNVGVGGFDGDLNTDFVGLSFSAVFGQPDQSTAQVFINDLPDATVTTVNPAPNPSVYGNTVTISTVVRPAGSVFGVPSGTVTFSIDNVPQTPVQLVNGAAQLQVANLLAGPH